MRRGALAAIMAASQNQPGTAMSAERIPVPLSTCYRLLNHGPTVMVSSAHGGKANVMSAAWSMPLDFDPPKMAVVIDKSTLTRQLVEASGEFVLNVPSVALAALTVTVGSESGRDLDKFATHGIATLQAAQVAAPLIGGCLAWLECRVIPEPHIERTYDLFLGEVVAAWADPAVFDGRHWRMEEEGKRSIHYVAGGHFFETGRAFEVNKLA
jgi:flavin reductase (DIM6/NTAB) family NADH-FMN oxidoreductase RutF